MLFNSIVFLFAFLPVVALVFFALVRTSQIAASTWLCIASLFFYGYWDIRYIWLLLFSIVLNYSAGYCIVRGGTSRASRVFLTVAITANLLLLIYYKYASLFVATFNSAAGTNLPIFSLVLPLGISFFTFTQIAFLVDAYQGKAKEYSFMNYLLFVTYFPHLIAGPIMHHSQMMPQFSRPETYRVNWNHIVIGIIFLTIGMAKKVLIADTCALYATPVFNAANAGTPLLFMDTWLGVYAYALQLYFDFSGYCDMAIGISYMFNIRLPYNFNSPYKAANIIDFWRRWHMTLSTFLRDYLYIPLGGNRLGATRRHMNLMITMLLGGLWHGAGWTFLIWGGLHGLYLVVNHAFHAFRRTVGWRDNYFGRPGKVVSTGITFLVVLVAWVFFRASSLEAAKNVLMAMAGANGFTMVAKLVYHCKLIYHPIFLPGLLLIWAMPNTQELLGLKNTTGKDPEELTVVPPWWSWLCIGILLGTSILAILWSRTPSEFLYYQF